MRKTLKKCLICLLAITVMATFSTPAFADVEADSAETAAKGDQMTLYGFYLYRSDGTLNKYDKWGDATLLESNGEYLLIDTGANLDMENGSILCKYLKKIGVQELDVYISHLHGDHTGGLKYVCEDFVVNTLYLPDESLATEYRTPNTDKPIAEIYKDMKNIAKKEQKQNGRTGSMIQFLCPDCRTAASNGATSAFTVGSVSAKVMGPVGKYKLSQFKSQAGWCGTQEGHYLNNHSLATMFTCGDIKYLNSGDIEEIEEGNLVSKYGSKIDADIWKGNHHGLRTSSSIKYLDKVTPRWVYVENHGYYSNTANMDGMNRLLKYGYVTQTSSNQYSTIYVVKNNKVEVYLDKNRNGINDENPVTGWKKCYSKYQYYKSDGTAANGLTKIGEKYYYFTGQYGYKKTSGSATIDGVKCKFDSSGVMTSPLKPGKPAIKSATAQKDGTNLISWKKATNASSYEVYRATSKNGDYSKLDTATGLSFKDTTAKSGKKYYYKVRAVMKLSSYKFYGSFSAKKYCVTK